MTPKIKAAPGDKTEAAFKGDQNIHFTEPLANEQSFGTRSVQSSSPDRGNPYSAQTLQIAQSVLTTGDSAHIHCMSDTRQRGSDAQKAAKEPGADSVAQLLIDPIRSRTKREVQHPEWRSA